MTDLHQEVAQLKTQVTRLTSMLEKQSENQMPVVDGKTDEPGSEEPGQQGPTSRRQVLKLAGAAAVGVAGASIAGAAPAQAAAGAPVILGQGNDAGTAGTGITSDGSAATLAVGNLPFGNGDALQAVAFGTGHGVFAVSQGEAISGTSSSTQQDAAAITGGISSHTPGAGATGVHGVNHGTNNNGSGVLGSHDSGGVGVAAISTSGFGVYADGGTGSGVQASGGKHGIEASGVLAPLYLFPGGTAGPPTTGTHDAGEIYSDTNAALFSCVASGTPGTWVRIGFNPLTPVRILDTRNGTGGINGPIHTGQTVNLTVGGKNGVPTQASAVVMNATVTNTTSASFLTIWPEGATQPLVSNLNWFAGETIPNMVTVKLGTNSGISIFNDLGDVQVILDLAGFYS